MMPLEKQVCSLELAKRLKELGVEQESYLFWWKYKRTPHLCLRAFESAQRKEVAAAFTVAELGEMLPQFSKSYFYQDEGSSEKTWMCNTDSAPGHNTDGDTEANARAKMLAYLIEQGIVKP